MINIGHGILYDGNRRPEGFGHVVVTGEDRRRNVESETVGMFFFFCAFIKTIVKNRTKTHRALDEKQVKLI